MAAPYQGPGGPERGADCGTEEARAVKMRAELARKIASCNLVEGDQFTPITSLVLFPAHLADELLFRGLCALADCLRPGVEARQGGLAIGCMRAIVLEIA
jgi:hypothetical protein